MGRLCKALPIPPLLGLRRRLSVRVAIVGSRNYPRSSEICACIDSYRKDELVIISGGARGVDEMAATYARFVGIPLVEHLPDWDTFGKSAGFRRNKLIIDDADEVHAFWDGSSRGTKSSIDLATRAGKPLTIHYADNRAKPTSDL